MFHCRAALAPLVLLLCLAPARADDPLNALPTSVAAQRMSLPPGFKATLFAGEPDVVQPIAFCFDDRGRLWVAENFSYPHWQTDGKPGNDRILIFDDPDATGHFKTRTVFADNLSNVSGLEIGFGGVWVCSAPNLLFIPMKGDKPAGPPQVVLDGWSLKTQHNIFNRLTWGPDGWLYGCHGILATSSVGAPGTPEEQRTKINCGVWRYHPQTRRFEVVSSGTTNPWGLDYDDMGQIFITNCVIKHAFHVIPGAHYVRMYGQDLNPNTYGLIESCADHIHWGGGAWTDSRGGFGAHSAAGGGHAHAGAMVYLGDNWPDAYRNTLFTCNIHGSRVNNDLLEHRGSGYVARHGKDFLFANDPWFRGLDLHYGPDGGVYLSDWTDTGECHNYTAIDQSNGRIYKVTYGEVQPVRVDLAAAADDALVGYLSHKNHWFRRHALRVLQERWAARRLAPSTRESLVRLLAQKKPAADTLSLLWALHVTGGVPANLLDTLLGNDEPYVQGWAIRLGVDAENASLSATTSRHLLKLAATDPSPVVRLHLASALQRIPPDQRWSLAEALAGHAEDAADPNIPLMIWYGVEGIIPSAPDRAASLIVHSRVPLLREYAARRLSAPSSPQFEPLIRVLAASKDAELDGAVLSGINESLKGERQFAPPAHWDSVAPRLLASDSASVREKAQILAATFGNPAAFAALRKTVLDPTADLGARQRCLTALVQHKDPDLPKTLTAALGDPTLASPALRALADCPGEETARAILDHYQTLTPAQKKDAVNTLASRADWAVGMLTAVDQGRIPRTDVSSTVVRQLMTHGDPRIQQMIGKVWGSFHWTADDKRLTITKFKAIYTADSLKGADVSNGRAVFAKTCAQCHTLFDAGGHVGPELTGSQRANLEYLFENVIDPSAVVAREYKMTIVNTRDGRVLNGILQQEAPTAITLRTTTEDLVIPRKEIKTQKTSEQSMMPEGLLEGLSPNDCRDLLAYLRSAAQVPLKP